MKTKAIKGTMSDLKPTLQGLKSRYEEIERGKPGKEMSMEDRQEQDLKDIKTHGIGRNG